MNSMQTSVRFFLKYAINVSINHEKYVTLVLLSIFNHVKVNKY